MTSDDLQRKQIIEKMWGELTNDPKPLITIFSSVYLLFSEALICYRYRAHAATAVLCRVTLESCVHLVLSRKRSNDWSEDEIKPGFEGLSWPQLAERSSRERVLQPEISSIQRVRKVGNFGAHLSQKVDQQLLRDILNPRMASTGSQSKYWVTSEQALDSLQETLLILQRITSRMLGSLE